MTRLELDDFEAAEAHAARLGCTRVVPRSASQIRRTIKEDFFEGCSEYLRWGMGRAFFDESSEKFREQFATRRERILQRIPLDAAELLEILISTYAKPGWWDRLRAAARDQVEMSIALHSGGGGGVATQLNLFEGNTV